MSDSYEKMNRTMNRGAKGDTETRYIPQGMNAQRLHEEELAQVAERQRQGTLDLGDDVQDTKEGTGSGIAG